VKSRMLTILVMHLMCLPVRPLKRMSKKFTGRHLL
jgi:hypothetical protein